MMGLLRKILSLFKSNYTLIYTAIGDEECTKIIGKLSDERIPYRTKVRGLYAGREKRNLGFDTKLAQYDIYVKKGYENKGRLTIEK